MIQKTFSASFLTSQLDTEPNTIKDIGRDENLRREYGHELVITKGRNITYQLIYSKIKNTECIFIRYTLYVKLSYFNLI